MAEFVEVMKNGKRMCNAHKECNEMCSFYNTLEEMCNFWDNDIDEIIKAEEMIIAWAQEHPAQTNEDKFEEIFGFKPLKKCVFNKNCIRCEYYPNNYCGQKWWNEEYKAPTEGVGE